MKFKSTLAVAMIVILSSGCKGGTEPQNVQTASTKPSTQNTQDHSSSADNELLIYTVWPQFYIKEEIWEQQVGQYLAKKFPQVTFKHIQWDNPDIKTLHSR